MPFTRSFFSSFILFVLMASTLQAFQESENSKDEESEIDKAWKKLSENEPEATEAILFFAKRPEEAVKHFAERMVSLRLDEDTFSSNLEKLGSDDEAVAKAAFEKFQYLDPRLFLGLEEIMARIEEEPTRSRMVEVLSGRDFGSLAGEDIELRAIAGDEEGDTYFNFSSGGGSWWAEAKVSRLGAGAWLNKPAWTRAIRAIKILEEIGTPESTRLLSRMAQGHEDAKPTSIAKEIAMRIKLNGKK